MNFNEAIKQTSRSFGAKLVKKKTFVLPLIAILALLEAYIGLGIKLFKELFGLGILHDNVMAVILACIYLPALLFALWVLGLIILFLKSNLTKKEADVVDKVKPLI